MKPELPGLRRNTVNVLSTWLLQLGTLLFALVSVPLVTRRFGIEGLGVWLLVQQLASHMQLLELGLASSLGRYLSRDHARHDSVAYTRHASTAIVILVAMGAALLLLAMPLGRAFPHMFELPQQVTFDAMWMLVIAIVATGIMLPLRSAIGVLQSQHRFALLAGIDGTALTLRFILVIFVCTMQDQHALIALSLAVFTPGMIGSLVVFVVAARSAPCNLFSHRSIGIRPMRELLSISLAAMGVTFAAALLRQGGPVLAGYSQGVEAVPLIALPMMLVGSLGPFLGIGNRLISPIASQLDASGRVKELRTIYLTVVRYNLALSMLIFVGIALVVPYLLPIWLGKTALSSNHATLIYMNLLLVYGGYCLVTPAFLARSVLISVGKHKIAATSEIISAIVGLSVGWTMMETFNFGAIGMAYGITTSYIIRGLGLLMQQLAYYFTDQPHHLLFEIWYLPFLVTLPLGITFIPEIMGYKSLIATAISYIVALLLWVWLAIRLIVPKHHRDLLTSVLRRVTNSEKRR